ncbi:hypothetical protein GCM10020331_090440 [Ectobacillus funiculus]
MINIAFLVKSKMSLLLGVSKKAQAAIESNRFAEEIVPVEVPGRKGQVTVVAQDEFPRFGTTAEGLGKLRPAFKKRRICYSC